MELAECRGTSGLECPTMLLVGGALDHVVDGEANFRIHKLLHPRATDIRALNLQHAHDLNIVFASTMPGSHLGVACLGSGNACGGTVFLVHVVGARPAVVPDPHAKVLHPRRPLLVNLSARKNLPVRTLQLTHPRQEIPELRLGNNCKQWRQ
jgi:hypothetical protein